MVRASSPEGSRLMSANSLGSVARNLSISGLQVDAPGDEVGGLLLALGRLRQLHQDVRAVGGERPHRVALPGGAVDGRVRTGLRVRMSGDLEFARRPGGARLSQCDLVHVGDRRPCRSAVREPQHSVEQNAAVLLRARGGERVDQVVPACRRSQVHRADQRQGLGGGQHRGAEREVSGYRRIDLPWPDHVVGHPLRLDHDAEQRVTGHAERLACFSREPARVELAEVQRRTRCADGRLDRRSLHRGTARRGHQRDGQQEHNIGVTHPEKTTVRTVRPARLCPPHGVCLNDSRAFHQSPAVVE